MIDFLEDLPSLDSINIPPEAWLIGTIVLGVVLLFFGKTVIRLWLGMTGLAGGAYVGLRVVELAELSEPLSWIVIALLALAGSFLLALAYKACFFFGGLIGGLYLANYLLAIFWPESPSYFSIVIAVAIGLVAVFVEESFTITATAITGAMLTADSIVSIVYKSQPGDLLQRVQTLDLSFTDDLIVLLAIGLLAAVGIYVQRRGGGRRRH